MASTANRISSCARRVTDGLQEAGFKAFVVGGAVRDLLLGLEPKDFDVATEAHPGRGARRSSAARASSAGASGWCT